MQHVMILGAKFNIIEYGLWLGAAITAYSQRTRQDWFLSKPLKPVYGLYSPSRPNTVIVPVTTSHTRNGGTAIGIELMEVHAVSNADDTQSVVTIRAFLMTEFELSIEDWCSVSVDSEELGILTGRTHSAAICG